MSDETVSVVTESESDSDAHASEVRRKKRRGGWHKFGLEFELASFSLKVKVDPPRDRTNNQKESD